MTILISRVPMFLGIYKGFVCDLGRLSFGRASFCIGIFTRLYCLAS